MTTRYRVTFELDLRREWDQARPYRDAAKERAASGSTSIRLSKATAAALAKLADRVKMLDPENVKRNEYAWRYSRRVTPDELLAALATGLLQVHTPGARARVHATDSSKDACAGISEHATVVDPLQIDALGDVDVHANGDREMHASLAAASDACNGAIAPVHAKSDVGKGIQVAGAVHAPAVRRGRA